MNPLRSPHKLFAGIPRVSLANLPTPLTDAVRLREALGGPTRCPRILIKRDDLTGLAYGGNKVRKLEFLVADALKQRATTLVTAGAVQSNHCRATVAAGLLHGLDTWLLLDTDTNVPPLQGNYLLDNLMGATIRFVHNDDNASDIRETVLDEVRSTGGSPYFIPVGGSNPIGSVGYLTMAAELANQFEALGVAPGLLYYANGSRGTQAGIELGIRLFNLACRARGVLISHADAGKDQRGLDNINGAAAIVGSDIRLTAADITNVHGYIGENYAVPTQSGDHAIRLLARTEAIFLDPVYTGKAMGALIDHIRTGQIEPGETVVFVHTGGSPSIFVHGERLLNSARPG